MSHGTFPCVILAPVGQQGPPGPIGPSGGIGAVIAVSSGPYSVQPISGINIFTIYNSGGVSFQIFLPSTPAVNQIVQVLDAGLNAGPHNIVISGAGNSIAANGQLGTSVSIASNGGSISLAWDGTQWTQNG